MKKLTRERVVPIISAKVSWLIFGLIGCGRWGSLILRDLSALGVGTIIPMALIGDDGEGFTDTDRETVQTALELASFGVAEFWSGNRLIGFTRLESSELTLRIVPSADDVVLGTRSLVEAVAQASRLLARY